MTRHALLPCLCAALLTWCAGARAQEDNLAELDLATLMSMDVTVTSAAKRAQSTADAAGAVFVITREDIRRSGAAYIPEVLRLVPGVHVARINTRSWAVTARGFNSEFANKLQVMIDGRSVYAAVFSGVMWEEQFVPLDQIERIEVVRGPGGALWGVNAMNGVINIITRRAHEAQGLRLNVAAGSHMSDAGGVQYGAQTPAGDVVLYADHSYADSFSGDPNDLHRSQVGVGFERAAGADHLSASAHYSDVDFGTTPAVGGTSLPPGAKVGHVSAEWRRDHAAGAQSNLAAYYSFSDRAQPGGWDETMFGLDWQRTAARRGRHLATFGAGYRYITDDQRDARAALAFTEPSLEYDQWNVYVQDEIYFMDDRVRVVAGAKLEDFEFTGLEFQPTLRALWRATDSHTLWVAASRAARSPARFEMHSQVTVPLPAPGPSTYLSIIGSDDLDAEQLDAYELGWRWRPDQQFTFDLAAFVHEYDKLINETQLPPVFAPGPPPSLTIPLQFANVGKATAHGAELAFEWRAAERLRVQGSAHWLHMPDYSNALYGLGSDPEYAWSLRMRFDPTASTELDLTLRTVDSIANINVEAYESLDLRAGWRPTKQLELTLSVDNLLADEHREFYDEVTQQAGAMIGRSVFARLAWRPAP